jgi:hypothetical protein
VTCESQSRSLFGIDKELRLKQKQSALNRFSDRQYWDRKSQKPIAIYKNVCLESSLLFRSTTLSLPYLP